MLYVKQFQLLVKDKEDMENKIKIVVGTSNPHKIKELNAIASEYNIEFMLPGCADFNPYENGKTFLENAKIKAVEASKVSKNGELFLADDSGLCVDSLNGAPGIHSARYAETAQKRIDKLLEVMENIKERGAHFTCALCLVNKKGEILHTELAHVYGEIATSQKGEGGFGYDPIFIVKNLNKTMAELTENEKNTISHRGQALKHMIEWICNSYKG